MKQQEICQLTIKKHCNHDQFFSNLEQYVLVYPDKKLVYQVPGEIQGRIRQTFLKTNTFPL